MPPLALVVVPGINGVEAALGKKVPANGMIVANGVPRVSTDRPRSG